MLKKIKDWYSEHFFDKEKSLRQRFLDIKNHDVDINGTEFFLAKAMIPDIPEILGIERAVYGGQTPWDDRAFRSELMRKNDRLYLVLRRNDWLVAFIGCSLNFKTKDCHITNVAVAPNFQNHGLGYFLVNTIIKKARQMEFEKVTLEVRMSNTRAQRLYRNIGFVDDGINKGYYFNDREDALNMKMDITKLGE
ncbi:ribosomal-protein-alanine N-acetyltransferase RimI [Lentilactobacillus curieae]|uniref:Ribosomal-protein-alanine N-acetyltransferase RimI n=1 Tax=Lentilactobacillus curieae TaxID=1138822 RepID=A0A1S6QJN0_9LACO|nr:ribosomal protein S18-alanine N-acetyltransferase [Lentilactobacillus curieae]AQW21822.1 ribosomal-protein-alanine N-acetyltransferase RimI [Lentilactobacillus curieae]